MNAAIVRALATVANLPLAADRDAVVGDLLGQWLPAANDLSRKMSAAEHQALLPATVFVHAPADDEASDAPPRLP